MMGRRRRRLGPSGRPSSSASSSPSRDEGRETLVKGELLHTFHFDLGGEVRMAEAARLVASMPTVRRAELPKNAPAYVELGRPLLIRHPDESITMDAGERTLVREARIHSIGGVGVTLRVPFDVPDLAAVTALSYAKPLGGSFEGLARETFDSARETIKSALVETYDTDVEPESHLVIILTETEQSAQDLFRNQRQAIAGLLCGELSPERLSAEEVEETLAFWYRYYQDDLIVVDWERSLIIEPSGKVDDVLAVIELANLELLELRAYDRYLDKVLERSYEDLTRFYGRGGLFRSARDVQQDLSNARIDLVRVTDTINNIGKIFGDYFLAKLHLGLAARFHLHEWETIVREKMATLNDLYTLASHEVEHRRGMLLEGMIVLLFIIDLVLIYLVSK